MAMPTILDYDDASYNPHASDSHDANFGDHADPYAIIARWRDEGPVLPGSYRGRMGLQTALIPEDRSFTVVDTKTITQVLNDPKRFSNEIFRYNIGLSFGNSITIMDPPEHTPFRMMFQRIFLPQHVKAWGDAIVDPAIHSLLNGFVADGAADLMEFTDRFPFEVIYRQLNLPRDDIRIFQRLAQGQTDFVNPHVVTEASAKLGDYFRGLLDIRRRGSGTDLISLLAQTEVDGERLPEDVLIAFLRQLMNAAGDTTYRGTSVLLTALLHNPDQLAAVKADRSLVRQTVEEALRWDGPLLLQQRMAAEDVELGGVRIPAGSLVDLVAGAANRDPEIYPDPDRFDIHRARSEHWTFGRGPHVCVGRHLARVEMTRALDAVLDTLHNLRLDPDKPPPQLRGAMMRIPKNIHVRFDPSSHVKKAA